MKRFIWIDTLFAALVLCMAFAWTCEVVDPAPSPALLTGLPSRMTTFTIHAGQQQASPFLSGSAPPEPVRFRFRFGAEWAGDWRNEAGEGSGKLLRLGTGTLSEPVGYESTGISFSANETSVSLRLYGARAGELITDGEREIGRVEYERWYEATIDPASGCVELIGQGRACAALTGPVSDVLTWAGPYYGGHETPAPRTLRIDLERLP